MFYLVLFYLFLCFVDVTKVVQKWWEVVEFELRKPRIKKGKEWSLAAAITYINIYDGARRDKMGIRGIDISWILLEDPAAWH